MEGSYLQMSGSNHFLREHFNLLSSAHAEFEDDVNDSLRELLKLTWNIYGVSSLFQFEYKSKRHLKIYAKKLREEIASILPEDNVTYDAKFMIDESVSIRTIESDLPAIRIQVLTKNIGNEQIENSIYTGILISKRTILSNVDHDNSVKLPLLLCRGTKTTMTAVHRTLSNMFDCIIVTLNATEEDLRWLVPIILQPSDLGKSNNANLKGQGCLRYKIPGLSSSNVIAVKYDTSVLFKIWTIIYENMSDPETESAILLKHVDKFYEVLQNQMIKGGGMQLGLCELTKINFPSITIMENKMKATNVQVLDKVLLFFNEKATELLYPLSFDSTYETNSVRS